MGKGLRELKKNKPHKNEDGTMTETDPNKFMRDQLDRNPSCLKGQKGSQSSKKLKR